LPLAFDPADIARLNEAFAAEGAPAPDADALTSAAASALSVGDNDDALALLRAVLVANPKDPRAWALTARAFANAGDLGRARRAAEEAASLDEDDLATCLYCAELQARAGDADAARALVGFVLRGSPPPELRQRAEHLFATLTAGAAP
jgi:tetratricopeptide (TPR) repeat protein